MNSNSKPISGSFLPYGRQSISDEDIAAVVRTLKGDYLTQGPAVEEFECSLARYIGCKHVIAVNSGTAALHLAYLAMELAPGDAVIVPALTFAATANAALYCGATPIFADVDRETGLMTAETCRRGIEKALALKLKPRLVVPVHFAGLPTEMDSIVKVAKSYDCFVFEDACHALGAEYRLSPKSLWLKVGNWTEGSSGAAFSFHPVKHIATGEGGALATNNCTIASRARLLRTHGITKNPSQFVRLDLSHNKQSGQLNPWYYEMQELGWNYRMCDISASLGNSQLKRIEAFVSKRREIASWYEEAFSNVDLIKKPSGDSSTAKHSWHLYPVKIDFDKVGKTKAYLMDQLKLIGIGTQVHYIPVPELAYYKQRRETSSSGDWKDCWDFYQKELSLPMFPGLSKEDVRNIVDSILRILT